jgi:hypothetical protein
MKRLLRHLSKRDWLLIIGGLAVVLGLEMAKRPELPEPTVAQADLPAPRPGPVPTPVPSADPSGLPPTPEGLREDAYHMQPAPSGTQAPALQPDPGHSVVFFGSATRIEEHEVMSDDQLRATFDERMRGGDYFGAFAVSANGAHGWTTGYGTRVAARAAALAHCGQHASDCRIVAELLPSDLTGEAPENSTSFSQSQAYMSVRAGAGPRALAFSVDGAWAYAGGASRPEAVSTVLRNCEATRANRARVLAPMPCKIVATWD